MVDDKEISSTPLSKLYGCSDLIESGKKLYLNDETADVHFSIDSSDDDGTIKRIPAHKALLAAASGIFHAMFYGGSKVKGDVHVHDVSDAAFMEFLQCFYRTRIRLTIENIAGVMQLGVKYNVQNCVKACIEFLKDVSTVDNIFIGLDLATRYNHSELMKFCSKFVTLNTAEIMKTDGFVACDQQVLEFILKMDIFSCSEVDVFKACMAWVGAKAKQTNPSKAMVKKYLGDLYFDIRFASMTMPQFCSLHAEYKAVLSGDFSTITTMIVQPEFQAENFNNAPRHVKWIANPIDIIVCDFRSKKTVEEPYLLWNKHTTTFTSGENALVLGSFVCGKIKVKGRSGVRDLSAALPVKVEIFEIQNEQTNHFSVDKLLMTIDAKLQSRDDNRIELPHPVLIRPHFHYQIRVGPFPDEHVYYSHELKSKVTVSNDSSLFSFFGSNVKLMKSSIDAGKAHGFISIMNFNRL